MVNLLVTHAGDPGSIPVEGNVFSSSYFSNFLFILQVWCKCASQKVSLWLAERKNKRKKKERKNRSSVIVTFYEKTLKHKSKPSTSTSSALPERRFYFFSTQNIPTFQET